MGSRNRVFTKRLVAVRRFGKNPVSIRRVRTYAWGPETGFLRKDLLQLADSVKTRFLSVGCVQAS